MMLRYLLNTFKWKSQKYRCWIKTICHTKVHHTQFMLSPNAKLHRMKSLTQLINHLRLKIFLLFPSFQKNASHRERVYLYLFGAEFTAIIFHLQYFCLSLCRHSNELRPFPQLAAGLPTTALHKQHQVEVAALNICSCPSSQHLSQQVLFFFYNLLKWCKIPFFLKKKEKFILFTTSPKQS